MSQRYSPEVRAFIADNVAGRTAQELADMTNAAFGTAFTASSMKSYKANHKLKSGTPCGLPKGTPSKLFPAQVAAYIRENYHGVGHAEMAARLKDTFGLDYTPAQITAYCKNHKLNSGLTGRFEKGNTPPNKGRKGYIAPGCEKGWFKKGSQPWDTVPVGTIVEKSDGYLWKKINDLPGGWRQNWKQLHRLTWEAENGPVPEGCRVIFKDGNRKNCDLSNLALVTLAENGVMNRCGLRFEHGAHTETGILIAKVKIAAKKTPKQEGEGMNAKNGFYGVRKKDTGITSIFIDEETLEFGQLQKMVNENSRQAAKARQKKLEAAAAAVAKESAAERKARRRVKNLVKQEAQLAGGILVLLLAQTLGLADWRFTIPTILALVAGMAFNVGRYVGREGGAKK